MLPNNCSFRLSLNELLTCIAAVVATIAGFGSATLLIPVAVFFMDIKTAVFLIAFNLPKEIYVATSAMIAFCQIRSLRTDISTKTGERVIIFTVEQNLEDKFQT